MRQRLEAPPQLQQQVTTTTTTTTTTTGECARTPINFTRKEETTTIASETKQPEEENAQSQAPSQSTHIQSLQPHKQQLHQDDPTENEYDDDDCDSSHNSSHSSSHNNSNSNSNSKATSDDHDKYEYAGLNDVSTDVNNYLLSSSQHQKRKSRPRRPREDDLSPPTPPPPPISTPLPTIKPLDEPVVYSKITDQSLRRVALRLYKRLNFDPWDPMKMYNDKEVYEFFMEYPQTTKIRFDNLEHFSGYIFPLSVLCTLGASVKTITKCYEFYPEAIDECDVWIGTPLHYACSYKAKSNVVRYLISTKPSMLHQLNQFGRTPLHMACLFKSSTKTISLLLENYSEAVNIVDKDGYTPLHLACENSCNADIIKLLVESNPAILKTKTQKGATTPLHLSCTHHATKPVIEVLLNAPEGGGVDVLEMVDSNGLTPLHVAVKHHACFEVIELLIRTNPNVVNIPTTQGYSVLSLAKRTYNTHNYGGVGVSNVSNVGSNKSAADNEKVIQLLMAV